MTLNENATWPSGRPEVDWITTSGFMALALLLAFFVYGKRNSKERLPPGPYTIPFFGYLPLRGKDPNQVFQEAAKKYGPIVRLKSGTATVVALNDYVSVKDGLTQDALLDRERTLLESTNFASVGNLNGEAWRANRQISLKIMHELNWGRPVMQEMLQVEIDHLCKQLASFQGKPIPFTQHLTASFFNNITKLLFNKRFHIEDPRRAQIMDALCDLGKAMSSGSAVPDLPTWLYHVAAHVPFTRMYNARAAYQKFVELVRPEIKEHLGTVCESNDRDFIDAYLKRTPELSNNPSPHLTLDSVYGNTFLFLNAGILPLSNQLVWHLLNCADKADTLQRKIQQEIDEVVGQQRQPTWNDHDRMPISMACIWEMLRLRPTNPVGIRRACAEDMTIGGYLIPKGTIVFPNIWAVHREPKYWNDPNAFNYERFLNKDGSGLIPKPDQLMPFSTGKRSCTGGAAATIQIFLYLTCLLQKFTVLPEDGAKVDLFEHCLSYDAAQVQNLRFIPRSLF